MARATRIVGAATSLDSNSVQRGSDGRLVARSTKGKDKTKFIAYGAGAGFVIGSLLGKNVVGGLLGAAAGYLYGQHQNKGNGHEVVLKPGTEFGVRLDQRLALASTGYNSPYRSRVGGYRSTPIPERALANLGVEIPVCLQTKLACAG